VSRFELLVGSAAFLERAARDMAAARRRVLVQAMTFEGDAAGQSVAAAIAKSPATDRRVLVDDYTLHVINDRFLATTRDPALHAEAAATTAMFGALIAGGAGVRVTNPVGRNPLRYPLRNHKKLLVVDDAAYLGGINFSDHNFAWHDLMVRVAEPAVAAWCAAGFEADWAGKPAARTGTLTGIELIDATGQGNAAAFAPVIAALSSARQTLEVVSAYPTFPFVDAMALSAQVGAAVTLYSPRPNNKPIIRDYLLAVAARSGIELRLTPMMTHAKAALIDGEVLVLGSSNFDFVSNRTNSEYVAIVRDAALVAAFVAEVLVPLREGASAPQQSDHSRWRALRAKAGLRLADGAVGLLRHGARVKEFK
jgi:cardiolipin synthase A/B